MKDENAIENEIQAKGLNAPRLTPAMVDNAIIASDYHVFEGSQLTVCCVTLQNGFTVTGESACASPENFDADIGKRIAFENARNKIWALEGYLLKQRLYETDRQYIPLASTAMTGKTESAEAAEALQELEQHEGLAGADTGRTAFGTMSEVEGFEDLKKAIE